MHTTGNRMRIVVFLLRKIFVVELERFLSIVYKILIKIFVTSRKKLQKPAVISCFLDTKDHHRVNINKLNINKLQRNMVILIVFQQKDYLFNIDKDVSNYVISIEVLEACFAFIEQLPQSIINDSLIVVENLCLMPRREDHKARYNLSLGLLLARFKVKCLKRGVALMLFEDSAIIGPKKSALCERIFSVHKSIG
jgi:hypothetical protein